MLHWSLQLSKPGLKETATSDKNHEKIRSYIIFIQSSNEVIDMTEQLTDYMSWNYLVQFLVVVAV
jgi:hypothetical protein